ncbi:cell wall-binding repeat-containing protein [Clostridium sp. MSJ-11]|uniref:Cell wall-binding repeat-containing protein n=1 Tax=Clostridium mobile TaxID=2841512 RepID=A0ABS6EK67_9CLOT|nr:cell wall-binding repeat-containing protein [Clostridium mobile]MBU5485610.1 cell wall-binding repeat-containing protein [Clostridium mobile]
MNKKLLSKIAITMFTMTSLLFTNSSVTYAQNAKSRVYGKDRIETSIEISKEGWKTGSQTAIIAQGYNYADALCAAPLAKKYNAPIMLTSQYSLSEDIIKELKRLNVKNVYIIGGPKVVSEKVDEQLKSINITNITRLYGDTRYETSLKIADQLGSVNEVFITSANGYADSLSVAAIAAKKGAPIIFADKNELKQPVKQYINKVNPKKVFVIGGEGAISNNAIKGINNVERISGQDRFETNEKVLQSFKNDIIFENVYVVQGAGPKGNEFADALSCSALAAQKAAPIILTNKDITPDLKNFVNDNITSLSNIIAIGGEDVVPSSILDKIETDVEVTEINKDNSIFGEEKTKKVINGDLTVKADKVTLQNLQVKGVLIVDPGEKGSIDIKNVTANTIVVKSGGENSIHLLNSKAHNLIVDSKNNVGIELKESSNINNTSVKSNAILDNVRGNFGNVLIQNKSDSTENKVVLKGKFDKTVDIIGKANVDFKGDFSEVKVASEAKLNIEKDSKVEKISANSKCNIKVKDGATVNKVEKGVKDVEIDGDVKDVTSTDKGNGTPPGEGEKTTGSDSFTLVISKGNGSSELKKETLKIKDNNNAMNYLKSIASVTEKGGLITGIDGISNKTLKELSEEQRKRGIIGEDWFIYLNGSKTSEGADGVYPKAGDTLKFDYHEWDWRDLAPDESVMPIKISRVPNSIKAGENFEVRATCVYKPVYDAVVKVDGKEVARTDMDGCATITINSTGKHTVSVEKESGKDEKTIEVTPNGSSGGDNGGDNGGEIDPEKPLDNAFKMTSNGDKVQMKITNEENGEITITLYDSNNSLVYIGQDTLNNGAVKFNTVLDNGKYYGFYKFKNKEKVKVEFEIK